MPEMIMFVGPPFSGKTLHYQRHFKSTHRRLSTSELYADHPEWGLRNVALHVLAILRGGENVVLDDENWQRKTRVSIIQLIKSKEPTYQLKCIIFKPRNDLECYWRREWVLARCFLARGGEEGMRQPAIDILSTQGRIGKWFQHAAGTKVSDIEWVDQSEGWHHIEEKQTCLEAETSYKFEVPAVFLEWTAMQHGDLKELSAALRLWKEHAPCGRVIVLAALQDNEGGSDAARVEEIFKMAKSVSKNCEFPIYFVITKDQEQSGTFSRAPQPGILAFLQSIHKLDLHHSGTVYVHQSVGKAVVNFTHTGMKQLACSAVCRNPHLLVISQSDRMSEDVHPSLTDIAFVRDAENDAPHVPLLDRLEDLDSQCGEWISEEMWGRVLGIAVKDRQCMQRYQKEYEELASCISASESKMTLKPLHPNSLQKFSVLSRTSDDQPAPQRSSSISGGNSPTKVPAWMRHKGVADRETVVESKETGKRGILTKTASVPAQGEPRHTNDETSSLPKTIYCMTVRELKEVAKQFLSEISDDGNCDHSMLHEQSKVGLPRSIPIQDETTADVRQRRGNLHRSPCTLIEAGALSDEKGGSDTSEEMVDELPVSSGEESEEDVTKGTLKRAAEDEDGDIAGIITDFIPVESKLRKPPPKKNTGRPHGMESPKLCTSEEDKPSQMMSTPPLRTKLAGKHYVQDVSFLDEIF
ncbi:uncharacterized protein [Diadema setosum]|uniref:uncharacterized protein n=1 Tax=Diadema setosum TaxID=31175 RepID=UPI003B3ACDD5